MDVTFYLVIHSTPSNPLLREYQEFLSPILNAQTSMRKIKLEKSIWKENKIDEKKNNFMEQLS